MGTTAARRGRGLSFLLVTLFSGAGASLVNDPACTETYAIIIEALPGGVNATAAAAPGRLPVTK